MTNIALTLTVRNYYRF